MNLNPNRFARDAEAALLREHIAGEEAQLERYRALLRKARTSQHDAEQRLQAAQEAASTAHGIVADIEAHEAVSNKNLLKARGLLHPIRNLPDEVLSKLFLAWRAECDTAPRTNRHRSKQMHAAARVAFVASSICQQWRRVAVHTSTLWNVVSIASPSERPEVWAYYLQCVQERSSNSLLDIYCTIPPYGHPTSSGWRISQGLLALKFRWRTVHFSVESDPMTALWLIHNLDAPMLEELSLDAAVRDENEVAHIVFGLQVPRLRKLSLSQIRVEWQHGKQLRNVESLDLFSSAQTGFDIADLAAAATRMPNLRTLKIFALYITGTETPITLNALHFLDIVLMNMSMARCFKCPQLEVLKLRNWDEDAPLSLGVFLSDSGAGRRLQKLILKLEQATQLLLDAFAVAQNVEELELTAETVTIEFLKGMGRPDAASGNWILPRLRRLHISAPKNYDMALVTCDAAGFQQLVHARNVAASNPNSTVPCALPDAVRHGFE